MKLSDYPSGLKRVLANIEPPDDDCKPSDDPKRMLVIQNVQQAMKQSGYDVSLSQANQLWSAHSYNSFAGWIMGGETVDGALSGIACFCRDVECGENHIDW